MLPIQLRVNVLANVSAKHMVDRVGVRLAIKPFAPGRARRLGSAGEGFGVRAVEHIVLVQLDRIFAVGNDGFGGVRVFLEALRAKPQSVAGFVRQPNVSTSPVELATWSGGVNPRSKSSAHKKCRSLPSTCPTRSHHAMNSGSSSRTSSTLAPGDAIS